MITTSCACWEFGPSLAPQYSKPWPPQYSTPSYAYALNMVTSVKKVVFTKSTTPVRMLPGTPVAQWESAGLLIFLLSH